MKISVDMWWEFIEKEKFVGNDVHDSFLFATISAQVTDIKQILYPSYFLLRQPIRPFFVDSIYLSFRVPRSEDGDRLKRFLYLSISDWRWRPNSDGIRWSFIAPAKVCQYYARVKT